jgi:hypothetical protein
VIQELSPDCRVAARIRIAGHAGANRLTLRPRIGRHVLAPGTYRVTVRTTRHGRGKSVVLVVVSSGTPSAAQLAAARQAHGKRLRGSGAASNGPPTADEQRKVDEAARSPGALDVGGVRVRPGAAAAPLETSAFGTDLPALVLAFLVLLGILSLAGSGYALRRNPTVAQYGGPLANRIGEAIRSGIARFRR